MEETAVAVRRSPDRIQEVCRSLNGVDAAIEFATATDRDDRLAINELNPGHKLVIRVRRVKPGDVALPYRATVRGGGKGGGLVGIVLVRSLGKKIEDRP